MKEYHMANRIVFSMSLSDTDKCFNQKPFWLKKD